MMSEAERMHAGGSHGRPGRQPVRGPVCGERPDQRRAQEQPADRLLPELVCRLRGARGLAGALGQSDARKNQGARQKSFQHHVRKSLQ